MTNRVTRIAFALPWWIGAAALAQQSSQPGPLIRTETRTVLVEAIVTGKKGEYIHDLTAKDFHLWQDGKEQVITSLSVQAKEADPHFLVLFFDETKMMAQDQSVARQAASRFIDANSSPHQSMAVVSYNGSLRVVQNFTDNAGRLKDALNRIEAPSLATTGMNLERQTAPVAQASSDNFGARNMLPSLANLAKELGVLPGRKTIVLLTGGLLTSPEQKTAAAAAIEASSKSGVAIYPVYVRPVSVEMEQSADPLDDPVTRTGVRGRNRGMDDSPRNQDPAASSQPLLLELASRTGGFLVPDSGEMPAALQRIGEEQSEYYVLSYTPPEAKEGSCHALKVKVDRGGTAVRARSSYCATKPVDLIAGTAAAKDLESRAADGAASNLGASIQLPYFYSSPGVARVHLAMEIAPDTLKFETRQGKLHAEINLLGIASTSDGSVGARFSDTLKLDFDNQAEFEKVKGTPVHYEKEFKITPGKYSFALAFGTSSAIGKIETPLDIEPWDTGELGLSSVALSRETHPAADLGLVSSLVQDRTPLIAEGTQFVPSGSSQFAKSDSGFFYLEFYGPNPASLTVQVRVLDRKTGDPKWDSGVTKLPVPSNGGKTSIPAAAPLPLRSLAAGAYRLEITASDSAGKQVKRTEDFEVK